MILLLSTIAILLFYLACERIAHDRRLNSIPLRISVTGTRGKTSVTRMLASVLREDGRIVLAKTTGSQARYILPDSDEIDITRRGVTSIIEQKRFIRKAVGLNVDCIVAEVMSIHPENHYIESQMLLRPNVVALTNVRIDHIDAMGETEEDVAAVYGLDIPGKARVFIPRSERRPSFEVAVEKAGADMVEVPSGEYLSLAGADPAMIQRGFPENLDLVCCLARGLGVRDEVITRGISQPRGDIGALRVWKYRSEEYGKECFLVNGFAANDPGSTSRVISWLEDFLPETSKQYIGILNLRPDRGDRTLQWLEEFRNGFLGCFQKMYVVGPHSVAFARRIEGVSLLRNATPEKMVASILSEVGDRSVILGMGNIMGIGGQLVEYWQRIGEEHGL